MTMIRTRIFFSCRNEPLLVALLLTLLGLLHFSSTTTVVHCLRVSSATTRKTSPSKEDKVAAGSSSSSSSTKSNLRRDRDDGASKEDTTNNEQPPPPVCGMYLAPSTQDDTFLGLFNGHIAIEQQGTVPSGGGMRIDIVDPNKNEWSPLYDFVWMSDFLMGSNLQNTYLHDLWFPGIGSMASCSKEEFVNVRQQQQLVNTTTTTHYIHHQYDSVRVHRSRDPTAGSFSYHTGYHFQATKPIEPGHEFIMSCRMQQEAKEDEEQRRQVQKLPTMDARKHPHQPARSVQWLEQHGVCVDHTLEIKPSSIPRIGRGAFTKRSIRVGKIVAVTGLIPLDRSALHIVQQNQEQPSDSMAATTTAADTVMTRDHGIVYNSTNVLQYQLLLNYAFGHPDSTVLLLPTAPGVQYINHAPNATAANVFVRWSQKGKLFPSLNKKNKNQIPSFLDMLYYEVLDEPAGTDRQLGFDIVALRNISAGEELFLDYGRAWQDAWERHVEQWNNSTVVDDNDTTASTKNDPNYMSAAEYIKQQQQQQHPRLIIRSEEEQAQDPYPANLQTACFFTPTEEDETVPKQNEQADEATATKTIVWNERNRECLRPCRVVERRQQEQGSNYNNDTFLVYVTSRPGVVLESSDYCGSFLDNKSNTNETGQGGVWVSNVPIHAVTLVDLPYTTDQLLRQSFRHEIGVPEGLYPVNWRMESPKMMKRAGSGDESQRPSHASSAAVVQNDFIPTPLNPAQLEPIRWADTGKIVTRFGMRLGLSERTRRVLLDYCHEMGITDLFRKITSHGNALAPGTNRFLTLGGGEEWYLQRPDPKWRSNLQWLSPADNPAHEHYLQALSVAGFDQYLESIGQYFGMDGLVAFHVTFIAVSSSTKGYMHYDVYDTGGKTFNIIVPLILANETGPELDLQNRPLDYDSKEEGDEKDSDGDDDDDDATDEDETDEEEEEDEDTFRVGRYRYEYEVASMMGDQAYHASSAVDYRLTGEMRMAATVYVADVNEDNVDDIMAEYTQAYPPRDRDLLLSWAGRHWKRNDPSVKLPKPDKNHNLVNHLDNKSDKATVATTAIRNSNVGAENSDELMEEEL